MRKNSSDPLKSSKGPKFFWNCKKILWHLPFVHVMYRYRIQYSVLVHTMNKGKMSQDLLLNHVPKQPWTKRLSHEIFYCMNPWKDVVSQDLFLYTTMNKETVSRDLLLYTIMKKRHNHEIFYCIHPCPQNKTKKFPFEPKITESGSVSRLFRFIFKTNENFVSVCFGVSNVFWKNWYKQICFKMNRNKPKITLIIAIAPIKKRSLFSCSFQNKPKQTDLFQNEPKQTENELKNSNST